MVVRRKLPEFLNWIIFVIFLYLHRLQGSTASSSDIQYCWSGEEGDNINWKNLSCATNELSLPDIVASKSLPLVSNVTGESNAAGLSGRKYYCMVFKYNVTKVNDTTGDITNQVKADYTCDAENWCEGRQMLEGYQFFSTTRKSYGYLFCCDSGNNCNTHQLIYKRRHQQTCYHADSSSHSLEIKHCAQQTSRCVKTVTKQIRAGSKNIEILSEVYYCDVNNKVCGNLTEAQNHSCRQSMKTMNNVTTETQTCCCKTDRCYKPPWAEGDISWGVKNKPSVQSSWQRTMLIIIGVALGILVVGVTLFFVKRAAMNKKLQDSPGRQYHKTAYRSVIAENGIDTDDTVQILPM